MSLLTGLEDQALFTAGLSLSDFTFAIKGRKITCDAEIRHVRKLPEDAAQSGLRIGLLFQKLRPGDQQHIASYVFEETRKYFSKYI
jgi:c-di-GMP-binding flagellar brake protein YcgR